MSIASPTTAGMPPERMEINHSEGWPGEDTKRLPDTHHGVQFFQDGLNTGGRFLGNSNSGSFNSHLPNVDHVLS